MALDDPDKSQAYRNPSKRYKLGLMIFRRDLRLEDNTALNQAMSRCESVIPVFIFNPMQIGDNPYKGDNSLQFMSECLLDLEGDIKTRGGKLFFFYGKPDAVVKELISSAGVDAVFVNRDVTPFSVGRDRSMQAVCDKFGIDFKQSDDISLAPFALKNLSGKPYTIFTPFFRSASKIGVPGPVGLATGKFVSELGMREDRSAFERMIHLKNSRIAIHGGRKESKKILASLDRYYGYSSQRDIPSLSATTSLSAYLKFGTHSIREVYHSICKDLDPAHPLIRQLYWRDFFYYIGYHFPHVLGNSFRKAYNAIEWNDDDAIFKAWCRGSTGFPIVDAGMRELNATGLMHNRVRMITASFLVKDLHIDWRRGERYFATRLIDYDPLVNNGNWQWSASTGCDSQPYFRIFNPWRQQSRFDPDCAYIKKWVKELSGLAAKEIHSIPSHGKSIIAGYPSPIVEHESEARLSKAAFASIAKSIRLLKDFDKKN